MTGIGIEFMTGAMLLSTLHAVSAILFIWIVWRIGRKVFTFVNDNSEVKTLKIKWELIFVAAVIIANVFFAGAQPRLSIQTLPDRELIEYQNNDDEIIIETPPPRTEKLEGFTPLKE